MSTPFVWILVAIGLFLLFGLIIALSGSAPAPRAPSATQSEPVPEPPIPVEPATGLLVEATSPMNVSGPHAIIARCEAEDGAFILVRTPLWEYPFNAALITQIVFDDGGNMRFARYARFSTLETGRIEVGSQNAAPVSVTIGPGTGTGRFPTDPTTIWTH